MKISLDRSLLLKTLAHDQSVVERRNTIPILANVLLRAEKGQVTFLATDMDLEIRETVDARVAKPGALTVQAHTLYDIVRKLPDGSEVEMSASDDGRTITVRAGHATFKLACLPVEDFPAMPEGKLATRFTMPSADLKRMIDRTRFAISTEENRYHLNGIYFHTTTPKTKSGKDIKVLRGVATDGHRLARVELPAPKDLVDMPGVIVPRKTVGEVRKLLDEADGDVAIELSSHQIRFDFGSVVLTSKLIDGTFPDYERVIPQGNEKIMEVDPRRFAHAVDRVATLATERSRAIKLVLSKGHVQLSANSSDVGSANEEIEADYDNNPMEIGFNARYLLDITQQISGEKLRFSLADAGTATIIEDSGDQSALYVLMPMRV